MSRGQLVRGSLGVSGHDQAKGKFSMVKAQIENGIYVKLKKSAPAPAPPASDRPTFEQVAKDYAERWIDKRLSNASRQCHDGALRFLGTVTLASGCLFTDAPFALLSWADVRRVIDLKLVKTTNDKGLTIGGKSAARALQNYLSGLFGWATDLRAGGYEVSLSPFARAAGGRSPFEKPQEAHRERRLQEG